MSGKNADDVQAKMDFPYPPAHAGLQEAISEDFSSEPLKKRGYNVAPQPLVTKTKGLEGLEGI